MSNIAGYKSCHTGVGKTSGWNMPMGWMVLNGMSPSKFSRVTFFILDCLKCGCTNVGSVVGSSYAWLV